ncbi:MAG: GNAT family N-acetyltransferase [Verrucomicrobiales bacterium]|nr:GNAT family N-acetyltransferase [Verrucomicrobiales bacterium]
MNSDSTSRKGSISLREAVNSDLAMFFEMQSDPVAVHMAAFTHEDSSNRESFLARWETILANPSVTARSIVRGEDLLGSVLSYEESGRLEVTYWIDRQSWGKGVATEALKLFLQTVDTRRPMQARAATDNLASLRVLEKCGFSVIEETSGFANARGEEIDEFELELSGY